jgi:hypothetical protein|uniref:Uncharacterized protein n=1 Tax=Siphoviridae sp. ctMsr1 TaxID=2826264 RepID=A0A8S5LV83_9CAUD|nr:MAG TPA: hypothetical protein [Siphoviridae sp. ctMsr1]
MKIDLTLHDIERIIAGYKLEKSELDKKREELKDELQNNKFLDEHYEDRLEVLDTQWMEVQSRLMYFLLLFEKRSTYMNALNAIYGINNVKEPVPDYTEEELLKKLTSNQKES